MQRGPVFSAMAGIRGNEADGTMPVLGVVPAGEGMSPGVGQDGTYLQARKSASGKGLPFDTRGPAERRNDAEPLHGGFHGSALHRAAVAGMRRKRAGKASLRPDRAFQKYVRFPFQ